MYKKVNAQAAPLKALQIYCCFSSRPFFKLQLAEIGSALVLFLEWVYFSCLGRSRTLRSRRTRSVREDRACIQRLLVHLTIYFHTWLNVHMNEIKSHYCSICIFILYTLQHHYACGRNNWVGSMNKIFHQSMSNYILL